MDKEKQIIDMWNESTSLSDISKKIYGYYNNKTKIKIEIIQSKNNLDINILKKNYRNSRLKHKIISKSCPICSKIFETKVDHRDEKATCSHGCANTYFRSNVNNPNWKDETYRTTCFLYHEKICIICGENKIVEVHHFDEDKTNNEAINLIPICPTHHQYYHSNYRNEVEYKIIEYRNNYIKKQGEELAG